MPVDSKDRRRNKIIEKRPLIGDRKKEMMLAIFLRDRAAFDKVQNKLLPEHFSDDHEKPWRLLWSCVLDFVREHNELPREQALYAEIESRLQDDPEFIDPSQAEQLTLFVQMAFSLEEKDLRPRVAYKYTAQLLEEKFVKEMRESLGGDIAIDLPELMAEQTKVARAISSIESSRLPDLFPDDFAVKKELPKIEKTSTGFDFFDKYMNGGMAKGEAYGLVAPYGVGKTLLSVRLCVNRAKHEQQQHTARVKAGDKNSKIPLVYLVVWEEEKASLQIRFLSAWGEIPAKTVERGNMGEMSTSKDPRSYKPYERRKYKRLLDQGKHPRGEQERLVEVARKVNLGIKIIDFTGVQPELNEKAANMARGVAEVIASDQEERGNPGVAMVIVDHADAAADTYVEWHRVDPSKQKRHLIGGFPRSLKQLIAAPFGTCIWVLHQLSAAANKLKPGTAPDKTDHAEAKNFFEYCNFGWQIGNKTEEGLCIISNGKHRRNDANRDIIIKIDGSFGTVQDTKGKYRVDRQRIVSAEELNKVADGDEFGVMNSVRRYRTDNDDVGL